MAIPSAIDGRSVTSLTERLFEGLTGLTSITIPDSVTYIGFGAFESCTSLTDVNLPASLTGVEGAAFAFCSGLTNITIHNNVTNVGSAAFAGCTSLASVTIPYGVISFENSAFYNCGSLSNVAIPNSVTIIGDSAFGQCASLTATIPQSVTNIGIMAFSGCASLAVDEHNPDYSSLGGSLFNKSRTTLIQALGSNPNYSIPINVATIGNFAFYGYPGLTNVTMPNTVTSIGYSAFDGRGDLTSITIPHSVTSIGARAFVHCVGLEKVYFQGNAPTVDLPVFNLYGPTIYYLPGTTGWEPSFADLPTVLWGSPEPFGFTANNGRITITNYTGTGSAVTIPDTINGLPVTKIGNNAFYSRTNLTSVIIPTSVTSIAWSAFDYCSNLTSVTIPTSVINIDDWVFRGCAKLTNIIIPNSVTRIGRGVFRGCASLTSITIPNSVTNIGIVTTVGSGPFADCASLTNITVEPVNLTCLSVDGVLFDKSQTILLQYPAGKAGSYTVPDGVTGIGYQGFFHCLGLTSITVPNSVTNIGSATFDRCANLTGVYFYGNPPDIGSLGGVGMFYLANQTTVYYLPGNTNWGSTYSGRPTALWQPLAQTSGADFGAQTNQFGFNINWASGQAVVVEACTNLSNPDWQPVQTNTLTTGSAYFSDPQWTNYPGRFYRLRSP